jgi:peptidoglycan hydrolase-like protein with peptidoglycan-binding domain
MAIFLFDPKRVRFEGKDFIIYWVGDLLPKHDNFPRGTDVVKPNGERAIPKDWMFRKIKDREVNTLYVHQTAGAVTYNRLDALINTYSFMTRDPAYTADGKWTGRGRGWPSGSYTFYIPYNPLYNKGRIIIFQCWELDWVTWHSSDNYHSIAIVCQGYFRSRHMHRFLPRKGCDDGKPSAAQYDALEGFIKEYAIAKLGIPRENIKGHCHSPKPKPACPGDDLEAVVLQIQHDVDGVDFGMTGEENPDLAKLKLQLADWKERQAALVLLGHDLGPYGPRGNGVDGDPGYMTRMAIEAQEEMFGFEPDGYWDDKFDLRIRQQLDTLLITQDDIDSLI